MGKGKNKEDDFLAELEEDLVNTLFQPEVTPTSVPTLPPSLTIEYLTVKQFAARLGVHEATVRNWLKRGALKGVLQPAGAKTRILIPANALEGKEMKT